MHLINNIIKIMESQNITAYKTRKRYRNKTIHIPRLEKRK